MLRLRDLFEVFHRRLAWTTTPPDTQPLSEPGEMTSASEKNLIERADAFRSEFERLERRLAGEKND